MKTIVEILKQKPILIVGLSSLFLLIGFIIFIKIETEQKPQISPKNTVTPKVAIPDTSSNELEEITNEPSNTTSVSVELLPLEEDITADRRSADKAGYEDGFNAGKEDAKTKQYMASYDETNAFLETEQNLYNENYKRGYNDGYNGK